MLSRLGEKKSMNGSAEAKLSDTVMSTASFEVYGMSLLQTVICQTA